MNRDKRIDLLRYILQKPNLKGLCGSIRIGPGPRQESFTLIELLIVMAILGTLGSIGVSTYASRIEKARIVKAEAEIRLLEKEIAAYLADTGALPLSLEDIDRADLKDPWGNPYRYLNFDTLGPGGGGEGKMRKDRFLVPLNSDYDLYSMGPDGKSMPPLTAKQSRDDIVRANNGAYVGPASLY